MFEGTGELKAWIAAAAMWQLKAPERISVKALDIVPSSQRSLHYLDREGTEREKEKDS